MVKNEWSNPVFIPRYVMTIAIGDITMLLSFLRIIFVRGSGVSKGVEWI